MEKCPICSGQLKPAKVPVKISGVELGDFDGLQCERCDERFLLPDSVDHAHAIAVSKKVFGIQQPQNLIQHAEQLPVVLDPFVVYAPSSTPTNEFSKRITCIMSAQATNSSSAQISLPEQKQAQGA